MTSFKTCNSSKTDAPSWERSPDKLPMLVTDSIVRRTSTGREFNSKGRLAVTGLMVICGCVDGRIQ